MKYLIQLIHFGMQQALSCVFPAAVFCTLAFSNFIHIPFVSRYDFILFICILVQWLMLYYKLESIDELKVICIFHILGLLLEMFKVHMGSWMYPEESLFKIWGVPLYSGFMYASVASYICQAWKRLRLKFINWPNNLIVYSLACLIYINFFTHHFFFDLRWIITLILFIVFRKTKIGFIVNQCKYNMKAVISFSLIGFFIWLAENIATFLGAWKYPEQMEGWTIVHIGKMSSWFLLVIISIIIVVNLKHLKYGMSGVNSKSSPS